MFKEPQPSDDFDLQKQASIFGFKEVKVLEDIRQRVAEAYAGQDQNLAHHTIELYQNTAIDLIHEMTDPEKSERATIGLYFILGYMAVCGRDQQFYLEQIRELIFASLQMSNLKLEDRKIIDMYESSL